jgi:hypothetical protein
LHHIEERLKVVAAMVKDPIGDNVHPAVIQLIRQLTQDPGVSKKQIDLVIIDRAIAMIGARLENWIQMKHTHLQVLRIVQFFINSLQVAPEKILAAVLPSPGSQACRSPSSLLLKNQSEISGKKQHQELKQAFAPGIIIYKVYFPSNQNRFCAKAIANVSKVLTIR